jgi:hypothetical protein
MRFVTSGHVVSMDWLKVAQDVSYDRHFSEIKTFQEMGISILRSGVTYYVADIEKR